MSVKPQPILVVAIMSQMQALGMFELFAPNPQHQEKALELIDWLNRYVD